MPDADEILLPSHKATRSAIPIIPVAKADWTAVQKQLPPAEGHWADSMGFSADGGRHTVLPDPKGQAAKVLYGLGNGQKPLDPFDFGKLARSLHEGHYRIEGELPSAELAVLGWLLEAYDFSRYKKPSPAKAKLVCPSNVDRSNLIRSAEAVYLVRDLVNTPSSDMGPAELEAAARKVASAHRAKVRVVSSRRLEREFPMIYAVGKASPRTPRLIDFSWGPARAPKVTLVGKGVCFDTGGLDIKPSSGMLLMKKDMGGGATVLGLAQLIMAAKLPVRLRVLIPAVENSISGNSFRPGDVLRSRKGLSVEIGNTDAEGRLVLADALALADQDRPDLMIDMATLTGAARVALGPDVVPFYTRSDELAADLLKHGQAQNDPVWRMPLWDPYLSWMDSKIADTNNAGESNFAGSITAALFLHRFVEKTRNYIHFDIFAWTPSPKPGRPKGGEAQAMRALFALISERYGK
jgi:leucyl aminopeptidase